MLRRHMVLVRGYSGCRLRHQIKAALLASTIMSTILSVRVYAQATPAAAAADNAQEDVVVTGTRLQNRTKSDSSAPIDVISQAQLQQTGQTNIFNALNVLLPSFELPAESGDISRLVRSARLRGLSPDDTLVLIDGKRRHVSANINADIGPVGGSDPVDLDMIPLSMIDHIEVLRDGAAAQYGSDAIAGVINIITRKATSGSSVYAQEGATFNEDGFTNSIGGTTGMALGRDGYIDLSLDYRYHDHTNRTGLDPRATQFDIPASDNPGRTQGDPQYNLLNLGYSAGYDFSNVTVYSTGTYAYRSAVGANGWRTPNQFNSKGEAIADYYRSLYPSGYVPSEGLVENDFGTTEGVKGVLPGNWSWDLSTTYGGDYESINNLNDLNASLFLPGGGYLIQPIPTSIHAGSFNDTEWTNNLDISRPIETGLFFTPLNVAFGGEFRRDSYQLQPGSYASNHGTGASAYPGFTAADATSDHRQNGAGYVDLAAEPLRHWQVDIAGRFEHYNDVGNTETGKITSRYDITSRFAVRGTVNNGFRAPTLAQEYTTELNVGPVEASGQLPATSAAAKSLGATALKPERSQSYSFGFTAEPVDRMHIGVDAYQIDIRDQIEDSGLIGASAVTDPVLYGRAVAALREAGFNVAPTASQVYAQFYTNGIATKTRGVDFTADYTTPIGRSSRIDWTLAANINSVILTHVSTFPNGNTEFTPNVLSEITEDAPKNKVVIQGVYHYGRLTVTARETRWGTSAEVEADAKLGAPFYYTNVITPKWLTDLEGSFKITRHIKLSIGANNLFNIYPNKTVPQTRDVSDAAVYSGASPFGFDGGFYYGRLDFAF